MFKIEPPPKKKKINILCKVFITVMDMKIYVWHNILVKISWVGLPEGVDWHIKISASNGIQILSVGTCFALSDSYIVVPKSSSFPLQA